MSACNTGASAMIRQKPKREMSRSAMNEQERLVTQIEESQELASSRLARNPYDAVIPAYTPRGCINTGLSDAI